MRTVYSQVWVMLLSLMLLTLIASPTLASRDTNPFLDYRTGS